MNEAREEVVRQMMRGGMTYQDAVDSVGDYSDADMEKEISTAPTEADLVELEARNLLASRNSHWFDEVVYEDMVYVFAARHRIGSCEIWDYLADLEGK